MRDLKTFDGEKVDSPRGKGKALVYYIFDLFAGNSLSVHVRCTFSLNNGKPACPF